MKRPWSRRLASTRSNQASPATCSAASASAATQFAARIATSIVEAQFGPSSGGLRGDPALELGAELVEVASVPVTVGGREERQVLARESSQGTLTSDPSP